VGVDESLARGLTSRLFAEVMQRTGELTSNPDFLPFQREEEPRRWRRAAERFVARNGELILADFISASKRDPTLVISILVGDEEARFHAGGGKCFQAAVTQFSYRQRFASPVFDHCLEIGAHTVQRLLQRADIGFVSERFDRASLLEEIRPLTYWAGFLSALFNLIHLPDGVLLFPVIPSDRGLYLCNSVSKRVSGVSVRTFVGNHKLRPEQTALRDGLREGMRWAARVPYFIWPQRDDSPMLVALGIVQMVHIARMRSFYGEWALELAGRATAPPQSVQSIVGEFERIGERGDEFVQKLGIVGISGRECFDRCFRLAQAAKSVRRN
jgi:hypothetical protein